MVRRSIYAGGLARDAFLSGTIYIPALLVVSLSRSGMVFMLTVKDVLTQATALLSQASVEGARLDAQVLLSHVLSTERSTLFAYPERDVTEEHVQQFFTLIGRRAGPEPVAYRARHRELSGLDL